MQQIILYLERGIGSFWNLGTASPLFDYAPEPIIAFFTHAHNGYLNLLVQVGAVGLIFAIIWVSCISIIYSFF